MSRAKKVAAIFCLLFAVIGCKPTKPPYEVPIVKEEISIENVYRSVCRVTTIEGSAGTGFFFQIAGNNKYYIMTSGHVAYSSSSEYLIEMFYDGHKSQPHIGKLVKGYMNTDNVRLIEVLKHSGPVDVAIIELDAIIDYSVPHLLRLAPFDYDYKDEKVLSAGFPKGVWESAWIGKCYNQPNFLLFEPLPLGGRSGSPLVNKDGLVIGIITSKEGMAVRMDKIREYFLIEPPSPE